MVLKPNQIKLEKLIKIKKSLNQNLLRKIVQLKGKKCKPHLLV
jgi:hypothetical protein